MAGGGHGFHQRDVPGPDAGVHAAAGTGRRADPDRQDSDRAAVMSLALRYAARSDRGLIREGNEDSVYAGPRLLAVADGMGGMAAGEVASHIVVSQLAHLDEDVPPADLTGALRRAIQSANAELRDEVSADPALEGMGTTLTAILFAGSRIGLAHIGDSRAYLYRGNSLEQIT